MTSCRWLSKLSGRSQPGALMKSEMMKISERRLMPCSPASSSGLRSVNGALRQRRLLEQVVDQAQHLDAPAARRDRPLDAAAVEDRPDAIAVAREQPRQRRDEIDQHRAL